MITRAELDAALAELRDSTDRLPAAVTCPVRYRQAMDEQAKARQRVVDLLDRIAADGGRGTV